MRIFVLTCDRYIQAVRPFAWLFNKYWSNKQEVVIAGYSPPDFELPDNFSFHSIGKQEDYPVNKWSDGLIKLLQEIPDEVVCLMLEDYWLSRPVDTTAIQMLYDYMMQFRYVIKMDLCGDRLYAWGMTDYGNCGYLDLVKSDPASQYHMSLMVGLWNKKLLLEVLIPDESPWDVELRGTPRLSQMPNALVLGTRQWPVRHILAHRRGNPSELLLDGLQSGDIAELQKMGYINA